MVSVFGVAEDAGIALEALLCWRLLRGGLAKQYPWFTAFVLYDFLRSILLVSVFDFRREWHATIYWRTEAVALVLLFAIVWEAGRHLFPAGSALRHLAWKTVLLAEAILLPALLLLAWGWSRSDFHQYPLLRIWPIAEQYFTAGVSLLLLVVAGVARYYGVSFGRNMRGLVVGFGVYLCLYAANFAALQTVPRFHVFWQFVSSISYSAMVACWLWAFWEFAPSRQLAAESPAAVISKGRWSQAWRTTLNEMRHRPS